MAKEDEVFKYYRKLRDYTAKLNDPKLDELITSFTERLIPYLGRNLEGLLSSNYGPIHSMEGEEKMAEKPKSTGGKIIKKGIYMPANPPKNPVPPRERPQETKK